MELFKLSNLLVSASMSPQIENIIHREIHRKHTYSFCNADSPFKSFLLIVVNAFSLKSLQIQKEQVIT